MAWRSAAAICFVAVERRGTCGRSVNGWSLGLGDLAANIDR